MEGFTYNVEKSGVAAIDTAAVMFNFRPMVPVEIVRVGVMVTIATTTNPTAITINHTEAGGAALTPTGAAALGSITVPVSAPGLGVYKTLDEPFLVQPGEEINFTSGGQAVAGDGIAWVQYRELAFQPSTTERHAGTTLTAPVADANWLTRYTAVTS